MSVYQLQNTASHKRNDVNQPPYLQHYSSREHVHHALGYTSITGRLRTTGPVRCFSCFC